MRSIAIIGAGPAGSICATLLARAQFHVTLIERTRFPRDKVCGECLSALGIDVLQRCGLATKLKESHEVVGLRSTIAYAADGSRIVLPLPRPIWGISRSALDSFLLSAARDAGATILQPMECRGFDCGDGVWLDLAGKKHRFDLAILADGKSLMPNGKPPITRDLGIKSHWRGLEAPRDAIELFGVDGHYGGIAPVEDGLCNISFSVPQQRVREARGNFDALIARLLDENPALARRLRRAQRVSDWLAAPLPRFSVRDDWPLNVIPVGNAAAAIEPIGGEGIGLAMRSAELAAAAILSGHERGGAVDVTLLKRQFRHLWNLKSGACRLAAKLISHPRLASAIAPLLQNAPALPRLAMQLIGK